jgi:hypothetical protein
VVYGEEGEEAAYEDGEMAVDENSVYSGVQGEELVEVVGLGEGEGEGDSSAFDAVPDEWDQNGDAADATEEAVSDGAEGEGVKGEEGAVVEEAEVVIPFHLFDHQYGPSLPCITHEHRYSERCCAVLYCTVLC